MVVLYFSLQQFYFLSEGKQFMQGKEWYRAGNMDMWKERNSQKKYDLLNSQCYDSKVIFNYPVFIMVVLLML